MAVWNHIAHTSLSLPASSVTWTSVSQSYDHLLIKISARNSGTSDFLTEAYLRVGDGSVDSGSNYSYVVIKMEGSASVAAQRETSQ